ncbi:glutathione S-transferase [Psychromonas sp. MME1]
MANGAHKTPEYLKISPFGQVPAIDDNGVTLSDSNAIMIYLYKKYNEGYEWYPEEPIKAAEVQRWLSVAAGEIAYGPCAVRLVKVFAADLDYNKAKEITGGLFSVIEAILKTRNYLAGEAITLADVACYSYISHVPEGGVSLAPYHAIQAWLERVEAHPRFVAMARSALPKA